MSRRNKNKRSLSSYLIDIISTTEQEAWVLAYEMICDKRIQRMLWKQYLSNKDDSLAFPDTLHTLLIHIMSEDRNTLRKIKNFKSFGKWLRTCYSHALWRSNKRYADSIKAYNISIESFLSKRKYEVDDRTWVLCIMLIKMENNLDDDWLFIFYRMLLKQFTTYGYEIKAAIMASALGITHQRYRDRITTLRKRARKVLATTTIRDLNRLSLKEQERVIEYVLSFEEQESLENILLEKYYQLISILPCSEAIYESLQSYQHPVGIDGYVFKHLPEYNIMQEPLPGSAEEEILQDNLMYASIHELPGRGDLILQKLSNRFLDIVRKEKVVTRLYDYFNR